MRELTPKQEAFVRAYLETGNACESYRRAYNAGNSAQRTIEKRASELLNNGEVTGRLAALRSEAASKAGLSRAWVLDRLMRNARIALGEEKVSLTFRPRGKEANPIEVTVTQRDANAANKALELLAKTPEVALFTRYNAPTVSDDGPIDKIDLARRLIHLIADATRAGQQAEASETKEESHDRPTQH